MACISQGLVVRLACVASAKGVRKGGCVGRGEGRKRGGGGVEKGTGRKGNRGGAQTPKG